MKKRIFSAVLWLAIIALVLSGCGKIDLTEGADGTSESAVLKNPEKDDIKQNEEAQKAYGDFLDGKTKLTVSDNIFPDDISVSAHTLTGEYSFSELKEAIAKDEGTDADKAESMYTLLDLGNDGVKELILRIEGIENYDMDWVGIIRSDRNALSLNFYYDDGYRTIATLYKKGYLSHGGSSGAGAHGFTIYQFDGKGFATKLYSTNEYIGSFADSILFDLGKDFDDLPSELIEGSMFTVYEYSDDGGIKIAVDNWSKDDAIRKKESKYIDGLVSFGAELISPEEMGSLTSVSQYGSDEILWTGLGMKATLAATTTAKSEETEEAETGDFTLTVYSDPSAEDYKALENVRELDTPEYVETSDGFGIGADNKVRFVCDVDGAKVKVEFGEWSFDDNTFVPLRTLAEITTQKGMAYECGVFIGETVPYFRLTAAKDGKRAQWEALPDMKDGETTFEIKGE
ncbi:MAG: hypothetical protein K6F09_05680 [Clostridiales bacterium]|nr:hypothetical protein [Clostridiales bacterium]